MTPSATAPALRNYSPKQCEELLKRLDPREQRELARLLQAKEQHELWNRIAQPVPSWDAGPLLWLTEHTFTEDHHAKSKGTPFLAHFPKDEYVRILVDY